MCDVVPRTGKFVSTTVDVILTMEDVVATTAEVVPTMEFRDFEQENPMACKKILDPVRVQYKNI
uniref:Uncharacterized protein n=1 Tax=Meloidogyne enterolobii TaxID=390850 RepID=A0A6V7UFT2_MELEN|nr:unnamed protein product [Meloidogyne enterolobii]